MVESTIGALFTDGGLEPARYFFDTFIVPHALELLKNTQLKDPKSLLQEKVQSLGFTSPLYKTVEESGPDHAKTFTVGVVINSKLLSTGSGKNKQEAEQKAAKKAIELL